LKFAKIVFWLAAIWGFLISTPLYFMFALISQNDPPPITHPFFFTVSSASPWFGNWPWS